MKNKQNKSSTRPPSHRVRSSIHTVPPLTQFSDSRHVRGGIPEPTADTSRSRTNIKAKRPTSSRPASMTAEPPRKKAKLVDALPGTIEPQSGSCITTRYTNTRRCVACIVSRTDYETIGCIINFYQSRRRPANHVVSRGFAPSRCQTVGSPMALLSGMDSKRASMTRT